MFHEITKRNLRCIMCVCASHFIRVKVHWNSSSFKKIYYPKFRPIFFYLWKVFCIKSDKLTKRKMKKISKRNEKNSIKISNGSGVNRTHLKIYLIISYCCYALIYFSSFSLLSRYISSIPCSEIHHYWYPWKVDNQ